MIAQKIRARGGFRQLLTYTLQEYKNPVIVGGSVPGKTIDALCEEFDRLCQLRADIEHPVFHVAISFHPDERITDRKLYSIAKDYLTGLGWDLKKIQWLLVRHHDTEHSHAHLVANRIMIDSKIVDDKFCGTRSRDLCRALEAKHNLQPLDNSRRLVRSRSSKERMMAKHRSLLSRKGRLQLLVYEAAKGSDNFSELSTRLAEKGVQLLPRVGESGQIQGISYKYENRYTRGNRLGFAFSLHGLQKHFGVKYEQKRDYEWLLSSGIGVGKPAGAGVITGTDGQRLEVGNGGRIYIGARSSSISGWTGEDNTDEHSGEGASASLSPQHRTNYLEATFDVGKVKELFPDEQEDHPDSGRTGGANDGIGGETGTDRPRPFHPGGFDRSQSEGNKQEQQRRENPTRRIDQGNSVPDLETRRPGGSAQGDQGAEQAVHRNPKAELRTAAAKPITNWRTEPDLEIDRQAAEIPEADRASSDTTGHRDSSDRSLTCLDELLDVAAGWPQQVATSSLADLRTAGEDGAEIASAKQIFERQLCALQSNSFEVKMTSSRTGRVSYFKVSNEQLLKLAQDLSEDKLKAAISLKPLDESKTYIVIDELSIEQLQAIQNASQGVAIVLRSGQVSVSSGRKYQVWLKHDLSTTGEEKAQLALAYTKTFGGKSLEYGTLAFKEDELLRHEGKCAVWGEQFIVYERETNSEAARPASTPNLASVHRNERGYEQEL